LRRYRMQRQQQSAQEERDNGYSNHKAILSGIGELVSW
jgi:hypothetical protein